MQHRFVGQLQEHAGDLARALGLLRQHVRVQSFTCGNTGTSLDTSLITFDCMLGKHWQGVQIGHPAFTCAQR